MGSESTINYGTRNTMVFSHQTVKEYFNIANINYYDVILGMPFLRQLGITLDFASPGVVQIGTYEVPRNLVSESSDTATKAVACQNPLPKPENAS